MLLCFCEKWTEVRKPSLLCDFKESPYVLLLLLLSEAHILIFRAGDTILIVSTMRIIDKANA